MPDCMRGWDEVGLAQALVVEGVEGEGAAAVGVVQLTKCLLSVRSVFRIS